MAEDTRQATTATAEDTREATAATAEDTREATAATAEDTREATTATAEDTREATAATAEDTREATAATAVVTTSRLPCSLGRCVQSPGAAERPVSAVPSSLRRGGTLPRRRPASRPGHRDGAVPAPCGGWAAGQPDSVRLVLCDCVLLCLYVFVNTFCCL